MRQRGNGDPRVLSASTICSDPVVNRTGENLGEIEELMIDMGNGRVAYAVVSFGGFLGLGNKLFAVPFEAFELDADNHCFVLDVPREKLEKAPGFDKDKWPDFADPRFKEQVYRHYEIAPPASR